MYYNISQVAVSYAALCGVLAGFAFSSLTFIVTRQVQQPKGDFFLEEFTEVMSLAFFGLIAAAILQSIRGGLQPRLEEEIVYALALTYIITIEMVIAVLLMLAGMVMMTVRFVPMQPATQQRVKNFSILSFTVGVTFAWITAFDFWKVVPNLRDFAPFAQAVGVLVPLVLCFAIFVFSSRQKISFGFLSTAIRISFLILSISVALLWIYRDQPSFVQEYYGASYIVSSLALLIVPLLAGWIQVHCVDEIK